MILIICSNSFLAIVYGIVKILYNTLLEYSNPPPSDKVTPTNRAVKISDTFRK
jgi:hypothetical protein